ncbi:MAG TPA: PilZ domain-containing protein [Kofleriaceae bacterium]|nr:PilZ domain-containing protein [Kofleriaceae bacterium]
MRDLAVRFESGKDVLNAYWGYLSDGGLVIPDDDELAVGEPVSLSVLIASASASYSLSGRVVRRDQAAGRAVIAFSPGQPHDMLLTQALADADKVPARRSRRFRVDVAARVRDAREAGEASPARLIDVSDHGCCVQLDEKAGPDDLATGTPVAIDAGSLSVAGQVVWTRGRERGVSFVGADGALDPGALEKVRSFVRGLAR